MQFILIMDERRGLELVVVASAARKRRMAPICLDIPEHEHDLFNAVINKIILEKDIF